MVNRRFWYVLGICLAAFAAEASDPSQTCNDMYPADSYESEERYMLIQECMQAYADPVAEEATDPGYYDGTVEDYVNQIPAEPPVE